MIDVYSWATPNGHKVHIMLEETGLEHRIHGINIRTGDQFKPEFLKESPNNRIPAIVDHDGPTASRCRCSSPGRHPGLSRVRKAAAAARRHARPLDLPAVAHVAMGGVGPMLPIQPLPAVCDGKDPVCHRAHIPTRQTALPAWLDKRLAESE